MLNLSSHFLKHAIPPTKCHQFCKSSPLITDVNFPLRMYLVPVHISQSTYIFFFVKCGEKVSNDAKNKSYEARMKGKIKIYSRTRGVVR